VILLENPNSVHIIKNYGRIVLHFDRVMDRKGITRNKLATLAGVRFEVADRLYKGKIERLDMDILARVCFVLSCQIGEVLEYTKPHSQKNKGTKTI
jgi:putative transcriptional regulator